MKTHDKLRQSSIYLIIVIPALATLALLGWYFEVDILKRWVPGLVAINPVTAILFICSSVSFLVLAVCDRRNCISAGIFLAGSCLTVSGFYLVTLIFKFPVEIDLFFFRERVLNDLTGIPGRMASNTAVNFVLVSLAVMSILYTRGTQKAPHQWMALGVLVVAMFSLLGYFYKVPEFYGVVPFLPMAVQSALCFLILSVAILFFDSSKGFMKTLTSAEEGSLLARRLIPLSLLIPVVFGYFNMWGSRNNFFSNEFGLVLLMLSLIVIFGVSVWLYAIELNERDRRRRMMESELEEANRRLYTANEETATLNEELIASNEELLTTNEQLNHLNDQLKLANQTILKQTDVIVRQKDEELNRVLDSSNNIIWSIDLTKTGRNYISRSVERLTGEPLESFLKKNESLITLIHPDDRDLYRADRQELYKKGTVKGTYRCLDFKKETHWLHIVQNLVKDEQGEPIKEEGIATDISAIKEAEKVIAKERNLLRSLIDHIPDYIFIKDIQSRHVVNNKANLEILGVESDEEATAKSLTDYIGDLATPFLEDDQYVYKTGKSIINREEEFVTGDGRKLSLLTTKVPLKNEQGDVTGLVGISRDITLLRQQEEKLRLYQQNLDVLFTNTIEEIVLLDKEGAIIQFNAAFDKFMTRATGKHPEVGNYIWDVTVPERREIARDLFRKASGGELVVVEAPIITRDGKVVHQLWYQPFFVEGEVRYVSIISLDITEAKKQEESLKQSRNLLEKAEKMAGIGYWTLIADTKTFEWSKETHRLYGLDAGSFDGTHETILNTVYPDDRERVQKALEEALSGKNPYNIDFRIVRSDGTQKWLHEQAEPDKDRSAGDAVWIGITQEITQRKLIEEALREFNERYEILARATNDAIWDWDVKFGMVTWNHGLNSIFGYPEREVNYTSEWRKEKIHPEDYQRVWAEIQSTFDFKQTNWSSTYRYQCADGTYKVVHDRAYVIYQSGEPVRVIGAMQDITEQTRAIEEIKKLSFVVSKTDSAITIIDTNGNIEWVNNGFVKLTGYFQGEVIGKKSSILHGPETDTYTVKRIDEKIKLKESFSDEIINYAKDGRMYWVKLDITPVFNSDGSLKNFIAVQTDITEQKEFSSTITNIARELANLIENANVPIFGLDRNGYVNEWNKFSQELTGYSRNELFGRKWLEEFVDPQYREAAREMFATVLNGTPVGNFELPILTKTRKRLIVLLSASPGRMVNDAITGIIVVAQNITELMEYKQNLERMVQERTRELNEALLKEKELVDMKSRFVSIASHEFRTPLSTISLAAGFVRKFKDRLTGEEIEAKIDNIEKQVSYMTHLLDDVLLVGKAEAGKIKTNLTQLDAHRFLTGIIDEIVASTGNTHRVALDDKALLVRTFVTDEKLMRNIVINLLTNAIKFSPKGDRVDVVVSGDAERFHLVVRDYGIGIPDEDQKKLYEPFYRGTNSSTIQGTGLGLSIMKKAVDLLGGVVVVKSKVGNGTEVSVTLPCRQ